MRIVECAQGGGFHPDVPGYSGAIRALLADDGTVLEVVPYGQTFSLEAVELDPTIPGPEANSENLQIDVSILPLPLRG